jgi:anti-sigma factor RsiW
MTHPAPLSDDDRERLSAYLDGELDEPTARDVQTRLNVDPAARAEAESLKRTWDLLDYLPRPEPSPSFTQRTLTRLSAQPAATGRLPTGRRRWLRAASWAAAVLLAGLAGYAGAVRTVPPRPTEEDLVRELRLIENLRPYESVPSLEFLTELDAEGLFDEDPLDS